MTLEVVIRAGIRLLKDNLSPRERNSRGQYEQAGSFVLCIVVKSEVNVWHSLYRRLARHLTILDELGLGSALSNIEGRYSNVRMGCDPMQCIEDYVGHSEYMSPRLGRHAGMIACVYSLRMWAIVMLKEWPTEVWVNRWCVGSLCLDLDMSKPRVKHATRSMQLACLMQRLMYRRRGFVAGCGMIVLSQGSVTRYLVGDDTWWWTSRGVVKVINIMKWEKAD